MLRVHTKKKMLSILNSILEFHTKKRFALSECVEAILAVKECLGKVGEKADFIVKKLDSYCASIHQGCISEAEDMLRGIIADVEDLQVQKRIVFFPYKASMWDSLESIWKACKQDARCDCLVVPIPYCKKENGALEACYEGMDFPEDVPIVDCREYNLAEDRPDVAYVHNPYDEYNSVTSVFPEYYSYNLKKYVDKLVYVPYYVTSGGVSEQQKQLPIYEHMDYMIAQSELFKEGFVRYPYYNKIVALGSPKFDRVINGVKGGKKTSEKTVMLNTSIACFLKDEDVMLRKLRAVFEAFRQVNGVSLIWRPHPLIEATINSMRPQLRQEYLDLVNYFEVNQIGVLDRTPDITDTVVAADAYIGEVYSSVVHLFGVAGKPVFILDNAITASFTEEEKRSVSISDVIEIQGRTFLISRQYNGLFEMQDSWENLKFCGRIPQQVQWKSTYARLIDMDKKIMLVPYEATASYIYDIQQECFFEETKNAESYVYAIAVAKYEDKVFYILQYQAAILEYNVKTKEWKRYDEVFGDFSDAVKRKYPLFDVCTNHNNLYIPIKCTNKILRFDMKNGTYQLLTQGNEGEMFSGIACDEEYLYLAEVNSGNIVRFNYEKQERMDYKMPQGFWANVSGAVEPIAHLSLIDMDEWIVTIPQNANSMVKVNKQTGESHLLIPEFWMSAATAMNGYEPKKSSVAYLGKKLDSTKIIVQRSCDNAIAEIDVATEKYHVHYPKMDPTSYEAFMKDQNGFEKLDTNNVFACVENKWFSLEQFLQNLSSGTLDTIRERQIAEISHIACNLDGTAGEKIHDFVMSKIGKSII
ncbi:MAG: hypothetical protein IJ419_07070 [Agathobacter sp.]|nr:hypothetical protein [Agathobacter sp.]